MRIRLVILLFLCFQLYSTINPKPTQAVLACSEGWKLATPQELEEEIDTFAKAGAQAYFFWQYAGDSPNPYSDYCSLYSNTISPYCSVFQSSPITPGINFRGAAASFFRDSLPSNFATLSQCGIQAVRIFANEADSLDDIRRVLQEAKNHNLQILLVASNPVLGDSSHNVPSYPIPASWYSSDWRNGYASWLNDLSSLAANPLYSSAVYGIELLNEPHCGGDPSLASAYNAWASQASQIVSSKGISQIGIGQMASQDLGYCDHPDKNYTLSNSPPTITISSGHYYTTEQKQLVLRAAQVAPKPFYVGEAHFNGQSSTPPSTCQTPHSCQCFCQGTAYEPCKFTPDADCSIPVDPATFIDPNITDPTILERVRTYLKHWISQAQMGVGFKYHLTGNTVNREDCDGTNPTYLPLCQEAFSENVRVEFSLDTKQSLITNQNRQTPLDIRGKRDFTYLTAPTMSDQESGPLDRGLPFWGFKWNRIASIADLKNRCYYYGGDGFVAEPLQTKIFGMTRCMNYQEFACSPNCPGGFNNEKQVFDWLEFTASCISQPDLIQTDPSTGRSFRPCQQAFEHLPNTVQDYLKNQSSFYPIGTSVIIGLIDEIGAEEYIESLTTNPYDTNWEAASKSSVVSKVDKFNFTNNFPDSFIPPANTHFLYLDKIRNLNPNADQNLTDPQGRNYTTYYIRTFVGAQDAKLAAQDLRDITLPRESNPDDSSILLNLIRTILGFLDNIVDNIKNLNPEKPFWFDKIPEDRKDTPEELQTYFWLHWFFNTHVDECLSNPDSDKTPTDRTLPIITQTNTSSSGGNFIIDFFTRAANLFNYTYFINKQAGDQINIQTFVLCEAHPKDLKLADQAANTVFQSFIPKTYDQRRETLNQRKVESDIGTRAEGTIKLNSDDNSGNCRNINPGPNYGDILNCSPNDWNSTLQCYYKPECGPNSAGGNPGCCEPCDFNQDGTLDACIQFPQTQLNFSGTASNAHGPIADTNQVSNEKNLVKRDGTNINAQLMAEYGGFCGGFLAPYPKRIDKLWQHFNNPDLCVSDTTPSNTTNNSGNNPSGCSQLSTTIPFRNSSAPVVDKQTLINNLDKFGGQLLGICGFSQNIIDEIKSNLNLTPQAPFNHYPTRFDAVVGACRNAGYNPNFCLAVWFEESAAGVWSNEFGCGSTSSFETSLDCFLSRYNFYSSNPLFSACNSDGLSFEEFMRIYSEGNCNSSAINFCLNPNFPGRIQTIYHAILDPTQTTNPNIVPPCR